MIKVVLPTELFMEMIRLTNILIIRKTKINMN